MQKGFLARKYMRRKSSFASRRKGYDLLRSNNTV
jgi:hypothetical protein